MTVKSEQIETSLLDELYEAIGETDFLVVKRYALLGKKLEHVLRSRPVAIMANVCLGTYRYKVVKPHITDWIRLSSFMPLEYKTPLEALQNDRP